MIDSQIELAALLTDHNFSGNSYRLSGDFTVTKAPTEENGNTGWKLGQQNDVGNNSGGNVLFKLEGNNHTITTDAMLFSNIMNSVSNLTIRLGGNLIATATEGGKPKGNEAIAPLAYSVCGADAKISNIQVKGGDYFIQAPSVGGVVVWAYGGATVEDCQCKAAIQVWLPGDIADGQRKYSGGIVATADHATITRCVFHSTDNTLFRNLADTFDDGRVVPETTSSVGIFYGGIVGGTRPKDTEEAGTGEAKTEVLITDCTSWFDTKNNQYKGAIVGYAVNTVDNVSVNGTADGCEGNWWSTSDDAVGTGLHTMTDEQIVGKRNAVTPTMNASY